MNAFSELLDRASMKAIGVAAPFLSSIAWPDIVGHVGTIVSLFVGISILVHQRIKIDIARGEKKLQDYQIQKMEEEKAKHRRKEDHPDESQ